MKKIICLLVILFDLFSIRAFAYQNIEIGKIEIEASVPTNYIGSIIDVYIKYEDDTTGIFQLKSDKEYKLEAPIPCGKAKVISVDLEIGNYGQYEFEYNNEIVVKKDDISKLDILVKDVKIKEKEIKQISKEKNNNENEVNSKKITNSKEDIKESKRSYKVLTSIVVTCILIILVLTVYIIKKHKRL